MLEQAVQWAFDKDFEVTILASNWEYEDYMHFNDCQIISVPKRIPPGHMRNIALSLFYGGHDDWCIILDDDTWIATGDDIIDTIRRRTDYGNIWALSVEDEVDMPIENHRQHELKQCQQVKSGVFIVRNGLGVYFNPAFKYYNDKLLYGEDLNFMARCCYAGKDFRIVANAQTNLTRSRSITPSVWYNGEDFQSSKLTRSLEQIDFTPPKNGVKIVNNIVSRYKAPSVYWEKL